MNLREYLQQRSEMENARRDLRDNAHLSFATPQTAGEIIDFYRTYNGLKRQMRPLSAEQVETYLAKGYAFVGAYYDHQLAGIVASKQLPENYPYFHLPQSEPQGQIYSLGGIYVDPRVSGMGIASRLSNIVTEGTQQFARETDANIAGLGIEVSYDNYGSLKIMSRQGNYIGFYSDTSGQEGLSILLYRPFTHDAINIAERPTIDLVSTDEELSRASLFGALETMAANPEIGGYQTINQAVGEEGNIVTTHILNNVANTMPQPTFQMN